MPEFAIIGAGNMANALIGGVLERGVVGPHEIVVCDVDPEKADGARERHGVGVAGLAEAIDQSDTVFLCVKPQSLDEVMLEVRRIHPPERLWITILAGKTTDTVEAALGPGPHRVVRAMPNTPALILRGFTVVAGGRRATHADLMLARLCFGALGEVIELPEEHFDAVTATSGSGPAWVFALMESLVAAAVAQGIPAKAADHMVRATVAGAGELALRSHLGLTELRRQVTSPGGTTEAGFRVWEQRAVPDAIGAVIEAATRRGRELR